LRTEHTPLRPFRLVVGQSAQAFDEPHQGPALVGIFDGGKGAQESRCVRLREKRGQSFMDIVRKSNLTFVKKSGNGHAETFATRRRRLLPNRLAPRSYFWIC
jgi:hypothetical protein